MLGFLIVYFIDGYNFSYRVIIITHTYLSIGNTKLLSFANESFQHHFKSFYVCIIIKSLYILVRKIINTAANLRHNTLNFIMITSKNKLFNNNGYCCITAAFGMPISIVGTRADYCVQNEHNGQLVTESMNILTAFFKLAIPYIIVERFINIKNT